MLSITQKINSSETKVVAKENLLNKEVIPLSKEVLTPIWKNFYDTSQKEGNSTLAIIFKSIPKIIENTIHIEVRNKAILDTFELKKLALLNEIRATLGDADIQIKTSISEDQNEDFMTPKESVAFLIKKHPVLKELQDKLGLEETYD